MNTRVPSIEYLAGLFDGEGSINITPRYSNDVRRGRLYLQVALGNTDVRACRFYKAAFGGAAYLNQKATDRHLAYWIWTVNSRKAASALKAMLPYLRIKKVQARHALAFADHMARTGQGHRITPRAAAFRQRCRERLIALHGYGSRVKHRPLPPNDSRSAEPLPQREVLHISENVNSRHDDSLVRGLNEGVD